MTNSRLIFFFIIIFCSGFILFQYFIVKNNHKSNYLSNKNSKENFINYEQSNSLEKIKVDQKSELKLKQSNEVRIFVLVKNEFGLPVDNANIEYYNSVNTISSFSTDIRGMAEIIYSPEKWHVTKLKINHKNYASKYLFNISEKFQTQKEPLLIVLQKGHSIKGIARNSDGAPLSNISINLLKYKYIGLGNKDLSNLETLITNEYGIFEFTCIEEGNYLFSGIGNGYYLTQSKIYSIPCSGIVELKFNSGFKYEVQVVDIENNGIANAKISYWCDGDQTLITNAKGYVTITLENENISHFTIEHSDFIKYEYINRDNLKLIFPQKIVLKKGSKIFGKILNQNSESSITCQSKINSIYFAQSNSKGEYEILSLPLGTYIIKIENTNCLTYVSPDIYIDAGVSLEKNFDLTLGKKINFKFLDANRKPIVNKQVYVNSKLTSNTTDEKGEIVLYFGDSFLPPFNHLRFYIEDFAGLDKEIDLSKSTIECELQSEAILKVFPVDSEDNPLSEVNISISPVNEDAYCSIYENSTKSFTLKGLPVGCFEITANKNGYIPSIVKYDVTNNKENIIKITLEPLYRIILNFNSSAITTDISKLEINALLRCNDSEEVNLIYNYDNKYFEFYLNIQDCDKLRLNVKEFLPIEEIQLKKNLSGFTRYNIELLKGLEIEGFVTDIDGKPIPNASICIMPSIDMLIFLPSDENTVQSDKNGHFKKSGIMSGHYEMLVTHPNFLSLFEEGDLKSSGISNFKFVLEKGSSISGQLLDFSGKLCPMVTMNLTAINETKNADKTKINYALYGNSKKKYSTITDEMGNFHFFNISQGEYKLSICSEFGSLYAYEIKIDKLENITDLKVRLQENLKITGKVVDENGKPLPLIEFSLIYELADDMDNWIKVKSDENGNFSIAGVTKDNYKVYVNSNIFEFEENTKIFGGDNNVTLKLKRKPNNEIQFEGQVLLPTGEKTSDFRLFLVSRFDFHEINSIVTTHDGFLVNIKFEEGEEVFIKAIKKGYSPSDSFALKKTTDNSKLFQLTLKNSIYLELIVLDIYTHKPIDHANIHFESNKELIKVNNRFSSSCFSDKKGYFKIDDLFLGQINLIVESPEHCPSVTILNISEQKNFKEILLGKGGSVSGQIINYENKPLPIMQVILKRIVDNKSNEIEILLSEDIKTSITDEKGVFNFKHIIPGKYYVSTIEDSRLQENGIFSGLPIIIEEGKETIISKEEIVKNSKCAKVKIKILNKDHQVFQVSFIKFTKNFDITKLNDTATSEDDNWVSLANLLTDESGALTIPRVPFGEHLIYIYLDKKIKKYLLKVEKEEDISLEIPID